MKLLVLIAVLVHSNYGLSEQTVIRTAQLKSGNDTCQLCERLVSDIKTLAKDASIQKDFVNFIVTDICPLIGNLQDECKHYVESYAPLLFNFLVSALDPTMMCKDFGLCSAKNEIVESRFHQIFLSGLLKAAHSKQATGDSNNSSQCVVCELTMKSVYHILGQKRTKEAIKEALDEVCKYMYLPPMLQRECEDLVRQYTDQLVQLLIQGLDPKQICTEIGLCTSTVLKERKGFEGKIEKGGNSIQCSVCEAVMKSLDDLLGQNRSEEAIKKALDEVCEYMHLPPMIQRECEDLVRQYTDQLVQLLIQGLDPKQICTEIGLCTSTVLKERKGFEGKIEKGGNSIQCIVCEAVMKNLDDLLGQNRSEEAIKQALDKVCGLLPSWFESECDSLVKQYTDQIVQLLIQGLDPEQICTKIGLCTSTVLERKDYQSKNIQPNFIQCTLCEYILEKLASILAGKRTEADIEKALDEVCGLLPTDIRTECTIFINQYTDDIIKYLIKGESPRIICTLIGLCTLSVEDKVPKENHSVLSMTITGGADSETCSICKEIVNLLDEWMKKQSTAQDLQTDLKKICGFLPQAYAKKCDSLVDRYGPVILQFLSQLANPRTVCEYMALCQNENKALKYRPLPLLGKEKCSYGPAYWCANLENAKRCQSVKHCQKYVWIQ
ncbi:hypothetical protein SNE40_005871 [Patella caerulea]|uniref:Uncharacterized protein n=1 Tax=Patella caerulea TaxID=87958 RepID=A0AAN8K4F7_PATCE